MRIAAIEKRKIVPFLVKILEYFGGNFKIYEKWRIKFEINFIIILENFYQGEEMWNIFKNFIKLLAVTTSPKIYPWPMIIQCYKRHIRRVYSASKSSIGCWKACGNYCLRRSIPSGHMVAEGGVKPLSAMICLTK